MGADFPYVWAVIGPLTKAVITEARVLDPRALMLRRGCRAYAPWCWDAGVEPTRLDVETRVSSLRALMLRRGCWSLASRTWNIAF